MQSVLNHLQPHQGTKAEVLVRNNISRVRSVGTYPFRDGEAAGSRGHHGPGAAPSRRATTRLLKVGPEGALRVDGILCLLEPLLFPLLRPLVVHKLAQRVRLKGSVKIQM